eukprot:gnl/TRDRNA2_/TRDRNA2_159864_c0_seq4.p2 gnl/TRDRNA2_/TRDRNA2_159864_c0~~gnl/TRDRNA2_/TRDRNA2_159864_c0_seq4.p2  ORF type:complete len:108 (-),score=18.09 gnl/TRDRNA2_/TRDRNA2_159864_c0_seq4:161-484(-)
MASVNTMLIAKANYRQTRRLRRRRLASGAWCGDICAESPQNKRRRHTAAERSGTYAQLAICYGVLHVGEMLEGYISSTSVTCATTLPAQASRCGGAAAATSTLAIDA